MSGGARLLVTIVVGGVLLMSVSVGLAAASIVRGGTIAVEVHDDDADVSVHAPAALIDLALFFVPDRSLSLALGHSDVRREIGDDAAIEQIEAAVPAVRDAWRELVDAPDFTMVEVKGDGHHIEVEKQSDRLVVRVRDGESTFDIALPLRTVSRALKKI